MISQHIESVVLTDDFKINMDVLMITVNKLEPKRLRRMSRDL